MNSLRYSNSSFRAIPLCDLHSLQIRAYRFWGPSPISSSISRSVAVRSRGRIGRGIGGPGGGRPGVPSKCKVSGTDNFTRWLGRNSKALASPLPQSAKSSNEINYISVRFESPPHICVLTTQTALTDRISFVGPQHFPKIVGQKGKHSH